MNLKPVLMHYTIVSDKPAEQIIGEINKALEEQNQELSGMRLNRLGQGGKERIVFTVAATRHEHKELMDCLRRSDDLQNFEFASGPETDE